MRSHVSYLFLLAALTAFPACRKYPACSKDKHCKAELGERCVEGSCQNCAADADCADKTPPGEPAYVCAEFRCQAPGALDGSATGEEGSPCLQRTECFGGLACRQGVCSLCTEDLDCSPSTCNLESGRCGPEGQCQTDDQCAMDEICDGGMCIFSGDLGSADGGPCNLAAVYFPFDSDTLTPKAQTELTAAAECMATQDRLVYLEAHADNRGTEEYNILLTQRRGQTVAGFLGEHGMSAANMQIIAKGSLESVGNDETSRSQERRVSFLWSE